MTVVSGFKRIAQWIIALSVMKYVITFLLLVAPKNQGADYGVELVFTELCSSDLLTGFEVNPMYLLST
ncbi:MAG: hypothetical protein ACK45I_06005 [Bacteroidota bacterium]